MSKAEITYRSMASISRLPLDRLLRGDVRDERDWRRLQSATAVIESAPIHADESAPSIAEIRSRVRRLATVAFGVLAEEPHAPNNSKAAPVTNIERRDWLLIII